MNQYNLFRHKEDNYIAQDYLLHLTILVFIYRKCKNATEIIKQYICDPDFSDPSPQMNPVWQKCIRMHSAIREIGVLESIKKQCYNFEKDTEEWKMLQICKKRLHSKIVISKELEKLFRINQKDNPREYERLRKKFLRFRKENRESLFKELPWPTDDFYFFVDIVKWCFIEINPGIYVLKNLGDSDIDINMFLLGALNIADRIPQRKSKNRYIAKIVAKYTKKAKKYELALQCKNSPETAALKHEIKVLETKLIKYNNESVIKDPHTAFSKKEEQSLRIALRGAVIGMAERAKELHWKANGFTDLPIEISPRGRFIRTRKHITGQRFRCIPAGSLLTKIQLELYAPKSDNKADDAIFTFLKKMSKNTKILEAPFKDMGTLLLFEIPVSLRNFSELMQHADLFQANTQFTVIFKGGLRKTVFLKLSKELSQHEYLQESRTEASKNEDNGDIRTPKLSGKQKLNFLLA
ncbi:MAG: hypothetical protein J5821_01895, partial [Alphaproteobacteria bacterium]|nr:hypothetical protein [Alphaproteobacteria bacterium]